MRKIFLFFVLAVAIGSAAGILSSCNNVTISKDSDHDFEDNTPVVGGTKQYTLNNFRNIELNGYAKIYLKQDSTFSVVAKGSNEALRSVKIGMENGTLVIERTGSFDIFDGDNGEEVSIYISMPNLDKVQASGVGVIQSQTVFKQVTPLAIDISGACDVDMHIEVPSCTVESSGVGAVKLIGAVPSLDIDISGAGNINAMECVSDSVSVETSGAGEAKVYAAKYLNIDASGAGNVQYKGTPTIVKDISGAADITQIN